MAFKAILTASFSYFSATLIPDFLLAQAFNESH